MLKINRTFTAAAGFGVAVLVGTIHAQVGRGGSEWLTARGDAQRTSWIRTDAKISIESMSKPGFELHWTAKLDNKPRQQYGLGQGVTANGVTLFVPMSIVTGSSNNIYALDNDTGYVVWQRHFDAALPAPTAACPGGITSAATRIVSLTPPPITAQAGAPGGGRAAQAYRSVLGEPGAGVPLEARGGRGFGAPAPPAAVPAGPPGAPAPATPPPAVQAAPGSPGAAGAGGQPQRQGPENVARGGAAAPPALGQGGGQGRGNQGPGIPGAPPSTAGGFGRPSGVVYAISSDGVLHVLGLPSGKDIQKPAEFFPANARWSDAVAVNTTLYTATTGNCGGAPNGVWAIDLESEGKPVVSWKAASGEQIVGALAFTTDGTLIVAKNNGIVALDAKTLQMKDSFTLAGSEFVTGPTIFRHSEKEIVAAATKDGRILLLDAASLGGADHSTALYTSKPIAGTGGSIAADSLATWQEMTITPAPAPATTTTTTTTTTTATPGTFTPPPPPNVTLRTRWILAPIAGAVVALKVTETGGALSLEPGWTARNYAAPATPIVVNGVIFALSTGRPSGPAGAGTPAVLRAYEGATGKLLWDSKTAMKSFASPGSFWSAMGQTYVGTNDGTLYAFGFLDERH